MAAVQLTDNSAPIGPWLDELQRLIFFQPDDKLALQAFDDYTESDMFVQLNSHIRQTRQEYRDVIERTRSAYTMSLLKTEDVKAWKAPDGSGTGCVAQLSTFALTDKATGATKEFGSLVIGNVHERNGKRVLVSFTEVTDV